jgi:hypothetical protein
MCIFKPSKTQREFIMKKLLLIATLTTAALQANFNPLTEFGPAPSAPKNASGSLFGGFMPDMSGLMSGATTAATGIPPIKAGFNLGITTTTTKQRQDQAQNIESGRNSQGGVIANVQAAQVGTQTAATTGTTSQSIQ